MAISGNKVVRTYKYQIFLKSFYCVYSPHRLKEKLVKIFYILQVAPEQDANA